MKVKKLLAGVLSAAMVLGTMAIPAFADNVSTSADFDSDIKDASVSKIILSGDIELEGQTGTGVTIRDIKHDCTIDLNGNTLKQGVATWIASSANVTIKNGTVEANDKATTTMFRTNKNSSFTFENVIFTQQDNTKVCYMVEAAEDNAVVNMKGCTLENIRLESWGAVLGSSNTTTVFDIKDTNVSAASNGKAIFGYGDSTTGKGTTYILSGTTSISSGRSNNGETIYTAGNNVSCPGTTTPIEATVAVTENAGTDDEVTTITYYSTVADAMAYAKNIEGAVIKLYTDAYFGKNTQFYNSIDLNGYTMYMTGTDSLINKDITFSNGYIKANNLSTTAQGIFIHWYGDLTFDTIEFTCENLTGGGAYVIDGGSKTFTAKNSTFYLDGTNYQAAFGGGSNTSVFENCTLNIKNTSTGLLHNSTLINTTYNAENLTQAFYTGDNKTITLDGATVNVKNCTYSIGMEYTGSKLIATNESKILITPDSTTQAEINIKNDNTVSFDASSTLQGKNNAVAKIGNTYYATLDAALAAAQRADEHTDGDTIILLADTSIGDFMLYNDIDLNEKTLTLTGEYYGMNDSGINVTLKNGTIIVKDTIYNGRQQDALFNMYGDPNDDNTELLTFDTIKFYCEDGFEHEWYADWEGGYIFATAVGSSFKAVNSEFHIKNCKVGAVFCNNAPSLNTMEFEGTKFYIENTDTAFSQAMTFGDYTNNSTNPPTVIPTTVELTNVKNGFAIGIAGTKFVVDHTTITATGGENGAKLHNDTSIEFTGGSTFTANKILLKDDTAKVINENNNSTINANIVTERVVGPVADTVKIIYENVTENEGEAVYDIYVIAEQNTINRLTSLQMALKLDSTDAFEMTVTSADGVVCTPNNGLYLFNFDGTTSPSATGTKIKIGQVKLVGYGTYTLSIDENEENQAHATTNEGENIVTTFVPNGGEGLGTFDITEKLENKSISRPTRKLTINIDFKNAVKNQNKAYQDMTVTVKGSDITDKVFNLGEGGVEITDNKATIVIDDLTLYSTYSVEVKGAGYRTAYYPTVNMNADKTLSFWNNYKDTAAEVEVGETASAKNTTFLAGEIVKDGKINIYDLSAVVSYFGTRISNLTEASDFARYDLDRDGKIDSKDVAYVLASWNR